LAILRPNQAAEPQPRLTVRYVLALIVQAFRGEGMWNVALRRADTEVVAICDVDERMLQAHENNP